MKNEIIYKLIIITLYYCFIKAKVIQKSFLFYILFFECFHQIVLTFFFSFLFFNLILEVSSYGLYFRLAKNFFGLILSYNIYLKVQCYVFNIILNFKDFLNEYQVYTIQIEVNENFQTFFKRIYLDLKILTCFFCKIYFFALHNDLKDFRFLLLVFFRTFILDKNSYCVEI